MGCLSAHFHPELQCFHNLLFLEDWKSISIIQDIAYRTKHWPTGLRLTQFCMEHSMSVECLILNKICIVLIKNSLQFYKVNGCPFSHSHPALRSFHNLLIRRVKIKIKQVFAQPSRDKYQGRKKQYTCTIDYSVISGFFSFSKYTVMPSLSK